ncbi:MAG: RluA family pseudouridine synthase [Planctomycetota bacterium]|nr:RluA family pseudouridine synthase [Planctomycetota bacterium]
MSVDERDVQGLSPEDAGWRILFADSWILVLDKSSGLLSVPGIGPEKADCLAVRVAALHPGARIVHRLDRDTSGVIIMALDPTSHRTLSMDFEARATEKQYIARVWGHPSEESGVIDAPIGKDMENRPMQMIDPIHGRPSVTKWRVMERTSCPSTTRLELNPVTGRSHQLRVHLHSIGHPILGDDLYAPPQAHSAAERLCLHALSLTFFHPQSRGRMTVTAPCPF